MKTRDELENERDELFREVDELVKEFGEQHRLMIKDSLDWLKIQEPEWNLENPINHREFIRDLVDHVQ